MQFPIPFPWVAIINVFHGWAIWWEWLKLSGYQSWSSNELPRFPAVCKNLRKTRNIIPWSSAKINNKHSAADPEACALCYCLGYGPFVWDASPKSIDPEGLGESRTGTRQLKAKVKGVLLATTVMAIYCVTKMITAFSLTVFWYHRCSINR